MRQNGITPSSLIELATAYWGSATLIAAIRLKVFDHLDNGPQTADALSSQLQSDPIATEALLEGCVSLDLLHHDENGFRNTAQSSVFLVNGKPSCIATGLLYNGDVYPLWNQLDSVVKDGAPKHSPEAYLGEDAERTANFVYGMHHRALGVGQAVASTIDLSGCRHLADVGGGPGTYAALLTKAHPELKATVLDLEPVVDIARDIVESMNASSRVECVAFDYYKDALPGTYDAALISGVLHREQPDGVRRIFQKSLRRFDAGWRPIHLRCDGQ